jgi:hypothetical protein
LTEIEIGAVARACRMRWCVANGPLCEATELAERTPGWDAPVHADKVAARSNVTIEEASDTWMRAIMVPLVSGWRMV